MSEEITSQVSTSVSIQPTSPPAVRAEKICLVQLKTALAKAQMEIFNPVKNRSVDVQGKEGKRGFGYEYAELNVVTEIIREPLAKNGLTYTQTVAQRGDAWAVVTTLMHESGEEKDFFYPLMPKQNMSQEQGFAAGFTYAKRQALKGIFGIADDTEDKDAQDNNPDATISTLPPAPPKPPKQVTPPKPVNHAPGAQNKDKNDDLDFIFDDKPLSIEDAIEEIKFLKTKNNVSTEKFNDIVKRVTAAEKLTYSTPLDQLMKVITELQKTG